MKKSVYKNVVRSILKRVPHGGKGFSKLIDNPAGTKFRNRCKSDSNRAADGTIR